MEVALKVLFENTYKTERQAIYAVGYFTSVMGIDADLVVREGLRVTVAAYMPLS